MAAQEEGFFSRCIPSGQVHGALPFAKASGHPLVVRALDLPKPLIQDPDEGDDEEADHEGSGR